MIKIVLREVTVSDGGKLAKWRNSLNVIRHCIDKTIISEETHKKFYEEMVLTGKYKQYIVEKMDDDFAGILSYQIGTVYFKDIDENNKKCELGMFPSDDVEWNDEGQHEAVMQMLKKAFEEFKLHKVYAYVYSDCSEEIELMEQCGFVVEGKFCSEILDAGGYRDIIRLAVIN